VPNAGVEHLDEATAKSKGTEYLFEELTHRIAGGPIRFAIHVQVANDNDIVDDATIHWPADRPLTHLGTIAVTAKAPDDEIASSDDLRPGSSRRWYRTFR
jgi:catalase